MKHFRQHSVFRVFLVGSLLLINTPLQAQVFKYLDRDGGVLFTDQPVKGPYKLVWQSGPAKKPGAAVVWKKPKVAVIPRVDTASLPENKVRFSSMIDATARKARIYPELLHAVVRAESAYDPNAVSRVGAVGLMQLMPATAYRYGVVNSRDPKSNLEGGARYLRYLLTLFQNNLKLALAAYNAGENAVIKRGNIIPPFPETKRYIQKVLAFYKQNRSQQIALVNKVL